MIMKVGIDRQILEKEISKTLYDININRNLTNEAIKGFVTKGFSPGNAQQIIGGNTDLGFLGQIELGAIAEILYHITNNELVNTSYYYDDNELRLIQNFSKETIMDQVNFPIVFRNMQQTADDMWVGKISIQDFVKLHQSGISTYNFDTQRDPIHDVYKGRAIKMANINSKAVTNIMQEMIEGTYFYDDITLNILATGHEDYDFQIVTDDIINVVVNDAIINLTDGAHRLKGAESALLTRPNITGYFTLILTNFDIDRANAYIIQKDKQNPIDKEYIRSKDITDLNNEVVKRINENMQSDMRGKIVTDELLIKEGVGLTYFSVMSYAISKLWSLETRRDARQLASYLLAFFNELIGIYPNELKIQIKKSRYKNYINNPFIFIYYLTIAKEIQNKQDWEDLLYIILDETDFAKNNPHWVETIEGVTVNNISHRIGAIIKKHTQLLKEVL